MNIRTFKALALLAGLFLLPAASAFAEKDEEEQAVKDDPDKEIKLEIDNQSTHNWKFEPTMQGKSGIHKFKGISIDNTNLFLFKTTSPTKNIKDSFGKFDIEAEAKVELKLKQFGKGKNRLFRFKVSEEGKMGDTNSATFVLLSKNGKLRLFLEKADFVDDMDVGNGMDINHPEPGSLVLKDPAR
jgi:hypothetical protein